MAHAFKPRSLTVLALVLGLVPSACVDKEKCDEALRVTREALTKDQPDIARQWRDRAWKICNDSAVTSPLDKEITDKEAEIAKRAQDAAKAVADAAQQRLHTAAVVWRSFDKLDAKEQTAERLTAYKEKADKMSEGLPPEYAKQIEASNTTQYENRRRIVEAAAAAAKK
jgi:hypothetical protein